MNKRYRFDLEMDGIVVVTVDASTFDEARREIMHYAMLYAQDGGKCQIKGRDIAQLADLLRDR